MDRFDALTVFVAVAEQRGFAKASRTLRISPPAVTRTIAALEAHLGSALFHRSTRSVTLTEEGTLLLERAREILAGLQDAEHAVMRGQATPQGDLRITAPTLFGQMHVLPVLAALLRQNRDLRAQLLLVDRNVRIIEEGIDVAVRIGVLDDSSLISVPLGMVRQCLVASPEYCAGRGMPEHPEQLASHDIIGGDSGRTGTSWHFGDRPGRGIAVKPRFAVNSVDARLAAAAAGLGIANVLSYQAAAGLAAGTLRLVLQDYVPRPLPVQLVFHPNRSRLPAVRRFIEMMQERRSRTDHGQKHESVD